MDGSDRYTSQMSNVSVDAEAWVDDRSQSDQRSRRDDPSGARPRTTGSSVGQPSSASGTQQFYTGQGDFQRSNEKSPPTSREDFIREHFEKLSKELKVGYFDVMVLYSENDYVDAEKFRAHLENDIFPDNPGRIKAVLYDGPELEGLSASKLQHLDGGFQRCTFTFVYLTKQFVECDWCNLSSETCLMEAIYNKEKKWCVVPVYTVQRNKADFRIPMGLNSLKGINYYNPDDFYRKGVKRLIGDKIIKREENEIKLNSGRYNYLVMKVKEDREHSSRMQYEHEEQQRMLHQHQIHMDKEKAEYYRSRSEQHQGHPMYPSGGGYPKTAGDKSQPPSFPPEYVPKLAMEDEDKSEPHTKNEADSMGSKTDQQHYSREPTSKIGEPSSMGYEDVSKDYVSFPKDHQSQPGHGGIPTSGPKEIHIHHHHYKDQPNEKNEHVYNITADNVVIGKNGKIIADGRKIDPDDCRLGSNSGSRESLNSNDRRGSKSEQGSTCFMDNGFPTGQSSVSEVAAIGGNSNAVENTDQEIRCIPTDNHTSLKETETTLKSAAQTDVKVNDSHCKPNIPNNISSFDKTNLKDNISNKYADRKTSLDIEKQDHQNFPNMTQNCTGSACKPKQRPINLPTKPLSSQHVAKVHPLGMQTGSQNTEKMFGGSPAMEETDPKQVVESHHTDLKIGFTSDSGQTVVKTPPRISPLQSSPVVKTPPRISPLQSSPVVKTPPRISPLQRSPVEDPDNTEVLKPVQGGQIPKNHKISESSLEVDGCNSLTSSTEENSNILPKDDLDIKAVTSCIEMGYQKEQIYEALKLLRQLRPGHHHFSVNEMLDALNGKTTSEVFDEKDGGIVKEEEEWETLSKEDAIGGCHETQKVAQDKNNVSKPITIKKPTTDLSESGSQKSKSQKEKCKIS